MKPSVKGKNARTPPSSMGCNDSNVATTLGIPKAFEFELIDSAVPGNLGGHWWLANPADK